MTEPRHRIVEVSYRAETIVCECGAVIRAKPDPYSHDSHRPLVTAWEQHRREAGLVLGSGHAWQRAG